MNPRVLDDTQIDALQLLARFVTAAGFYLAGGTAVALRLGHRTSVDLDWFAPEVFNPHTLAADLRKSKIPFVTSFTERDTLWGTVLDVKTSLIRYSYPLLEEPSFWERAGIHVASLEDLACMKLAAISGRGARKDFVDLYAIGRHLTLDEMLALYQRKYHTTDLQHVLYALTYFVEAEAEPMPRMLWRVRWNTIRQTIQDWVAGFAG